MEALTTAFASAIPFSSATVSAVSSTLLLSLVATVVLEPLKVSVLSPTSTPSAVRLVPPLMVRSFCDVTASVIETVELPSVTAFTAWIARLSAVQFCPEATEETPFVRVSSPAAETVTAASTFPWSSMPASVPVVVSVLPVPSMAPLTVIPVAAVSVLPLSSAPKPSEVMESPVVVRVEPMILPSSLIAPSSVSPPAAWRVAPS